jgi:DNA mismatch repair ATPase MutS
MKVFLMFRDRDFNVQQELPAHAEDLTRDLGLDTLFTAMSGGDKFLYDVAQKAMLLSVADVGTILYRQHVLQDCLANAAVIQKIYEICVACLQNERRHFWGALSSSPGMILHRSVEVLHMFVENLRTLKKIAETEVAGFSSDGLRRFFAMIREELSDAYFAEVQEHLKRLRFKGGVLISAELGRGNKGINYTLRRPDDREVGWLASILASPIFNHKPAYTFHIAERDEAGFRALSELRDRGINLAANALARSNDHILSFLTALRTELAFYIGCRNLHLKLTERGYTSCFPTPIEPGERRHSFKGLYDASLALSMDRRVSGNDVDADGKELVIITGANHGGKSTFLRSVGLAQLMMQCGMFVPAQSFSAEVCSGVFTHFKREEDTGMRSGKFDEELSRMSDIVDKIKPGALLLFNESFASTNEREGSEIARQIVQALLEAKIRVFFVTHQFDFAHSMYDKNLPNALFLRAERRPDGARTFRMIIGEPLDTSYGEDLYRKIFVPAEGWMAQEVL